MAMSSAGDDLFLDEAALQAAFGIDPLPHLRQLLAVVEASLAVMAQTLATSTAGVIAPQPNTATSMRGEPCVAFQKGFSYCQICC